MMKNVKRYFIVSVIFMSVLTSCAKKEGQGTQSAAGGDSQSAAKTSAFSSRNASKADSTGVIYVNGAGLYTETDEGKMKWAAEAALGDIAAYLGETKEASRTDDQKRTFFHIELNGKDYWVQDYSFEPDTVPGFISLKDTVLYKSESLAAMTDEIIPQYLIVAVYKKSLENAGNRFLEIAAYSSEFVTTWSVKEKFVKREAVETDKKSVDAMILAQVAMESKNDTIRAELFQNAIEIDSSYTDVIADLQSLAEIIAKEESFLKNISVEKINEKVTVAEDIDLLSIPDAYKARSLSTLKADSSAVATRKYIGQNDFGEEKEWLYIQSKQKKGWVQAEFIKM